MISEKLGNLTSVMEASAKLGYVGEIVVLP